MDSDRAASNVNVALSSVFEALNRLEEQADKLHAVLEPVKRPAQPTPTDSELATAKAIDEPSQVVAQLNTVRRRIQSATNLLTTNLELLDI